MEFPRVAMNESELLKHLNENNSSFEECAVDGKTYSYSLSKLASAMKQHKYLTKISVTHVSLEKSFLSTIATLTQLRHLALCSCKITAATAITLGYESNLDLLDLSSTKLGPRGCKALVGMFVTYRERKQDQLKVLNLSDVGMGHFGAQAMGPAFPLTLRELDLSHNALGHDGLWKLAEGLEQLQLLEHLDLSHNSCLDDGCLEVAKHVLPNCKLLKRLHLGDNRIGDTGIQGLAASLGESSLKELYIPNNQITCSGAKALAEECILSQKCNCSEEHANSYTAERDLSSLQLIDASGNNIASEGCIALAAALSQGGKSHVTTLDLAKNKIGDEGAGAFVELLDDIPNLVHLKLGENNISDARMHIIEMLLKHRAPRLAVPTPRGQYIQSTGSHNIETIEGDKSASRDYSIAPIEDIAVVARGRTLLQSQEEDSIAIEIPFAFVLHSTASFDSGKLVQRGAFGDLYRLDCSGIDCTIVRNWKTLLERSMNASRHAVLNDLLHLRHEHLLHPMAYSLHCTSINFLYNIKRREPLNKILEDDKSRKSLTWVVRLEIIHAVALCLEYLHSKDLGHPAYFHDDIRPHNVYISPDFSSIRFIDAGFGSLMATDESHFMGGGIVFGSRGYRCPRYERGSTAYDTASDMFSFGVLLMELLTGRLQGSRYKPSKMACDHYYDLMILKHPLRLDGVAGCLCQHIVEPLVKLSASCMLPVIDKRPTAANAVRLLDRIEF